MSTPSRGWYWKRCERWSSDFCHFFRLAKVNQLLLFLMSCDAEPGCAEISVRAVYAQCRYPTSKMEFSVSPISVSHALAEWDSEQRHEDCLLLPVMVEGAHEFNPESHEHPLQQQHLTLKRNRQDLKKASQQRVKALCSMRWTKRYKDHSWESNILLPAKVSFNHAYLPSSGWVRMMSESPGSVMERADTRKSLPHAVPNSTLSARDWARFVRIGLPVDIKGH